MTADNKQIVQDWMARGVNGGDLAVADELFDPNVVAHAPNGEVRGIDAGPKASVAALRDAFPDLVMTTHDVIAEDDKVATRWTLEGTHHGAFMDIAPTEKHVRLEGMYMYRITGGKIAEVWPSFDALGLLLQLK